MKSPFFTPDEEKIIKQEAPKAEEIGRFTDTMLELCKKKKLFHLGVPKSMGGHEMPVLEQIRFYEEASRLDGSFGWTVKLGASAGIFSGFMNQEFAESIYSDPAAFTAGSGYPAGTAKPTDGAYLVSGTWKYASGIDHATVFTANCVIDREDSNPDEPEIRAMAFLPDEIQKLDTWNGYGLKASASHNFKVENVIIPEERTFTLVPKPDHADKTLYHFPYMAYAPAALSSSMLGMTEAFLDETAHHSDKTEILKEARSVLDEHRTALHDTVQQLWHECEKSPEPDPKSVEKVDTVAKTLAQICRDTAADIYKLGGMKVLDESSRYNRAWRDLMTAGQHTMLL